MSIASQTLSEFRTDVKRRLNEVSADGLWTSEEIDSRINRAILRITMDTLCTYDEESINLRQNMAWYRLPEDTLQPLFIYGPSTWDYARIFPTDITSMDRQDRGIGAWQNDASSRSRLFMPFSYDEFVVWPAPNSSVTITLARVAMPTTLDSDNDETDLPLGAQRLVPIFACYLLLRKKDFEKAKRFLGEYRQRLALVKAEVETKNQTRDVRMAPAKGFDRAHSTPELRMGGRKGYY